MQFLQHLGLTISQLEVVLGFISFEGTTLLSNTVTISVTITLHKTGNASNYSSNFPAATGAPSHMVQYTYLTKHSVETEPSPAAFVQWRFLDFFSAHIKIQPPFQLQAAVEKVLLKSAAIFRAERITT